MRLQRVIVGMGLFLAACADDEDLPGALDGGLMDAMIPSGDASMSANPDGSLDSFDASQTLCAKYGGAASVEKAIKQYVIVTLATDCHIGPHLFALPNDRLARVNDCLAIQAQELFGCPGVKYAGGRSPNGLYCGGFDRVDAGLISQSSLGALMLGVASGLTQAGISQSDVARITPQLVGLQGELVESVLETPSEQVCADDAGIALDASEMDAMILL